MPVFQKSSAENEDKPGWIPNDLTPMVAVTLAGHDGLVLISLTKEWVTDFNKQVEDAERDNAPSVTNGSLPTPVETGEGRALVDALASAPTAVPR